MRETKKMGLKWVVVLLLLDVSIQSAAAARGRRPPHSHHNPPGRVSPPASHPRGKPPHTPPPAISCVPPLSTTLTVPGLNIRVFTVSSKSMIFQWDKVTGAASYTITVVQKNTNEIKAFATYNEYTVIGSVFGLDPNTEYTYTIEAKDGTGAEVATEDGDSFTAPEVVDYNISVTPKDSTTVEMEFVPIGGVNKYIIRSLDPADPTFFKEDEVTSSPAEVTGLTPFTEYEFSIMSANDAGKSQPTPPVTAKTLLPPPQIQSSSSSESSIELTWSAVTNAVEYSVCLLKYNADVSEKITQNTTGTSITFSGLDPGALYHVEGYGWDAENRMGEKSAESNQTTRPPAPSSVAITAVTTNNQLSLNVSWTMDPDVYGEVRYNVSSDQGQTCSSVSLLSCELTPVSCGEVHTVTVIALNDAGPSVPSAAFNFTTVPCPPQNLAVTETSLGVCDFTWDTVSNADGYRAFIKTADGVEKTCNTTGTSCDFTCECGYTYLMTVFAHNAAGLSQEGPVLNYTTIPCCPTLMNVSLVSTDTLEIEWVMARGAELYETRANDSSGVILCNDTSPVCALSYLDCDTPYSVKVIPCNDLSGCNHNCPALTKDTAACMPTVLSVTKAGPGTVTVCWTSTNRAATFLVTARGDQGVLNCSGDTCCDLTGLPCGSSYEVGVTATSGAGESLPSYTESYETEPCCPSTLSVVQVTQAMTNVSWSAARGAHTFLTTLNSTKGHARCHTEDTHCIMGCITCGTNYTATMEAYSLSGLKSDCTFQGFSSSLCCPSGVRIYRINLNELRVSWRSTAGASHATEVNMMGYYHNSNCRASPGENYCDLSQVKCGDEYSVEVLPVKADGSTEDFCPQKMYAVSCVGNHLGAILFRGKRSVE